MIKVGVRIPEGRRTRSRELGEAREDLEMVMGQAKVLDKDWARGKIAVTEEELKTSPIPRKVEMTAMTAMVALVIRDLMGDRRTMVTVRLELEGRMKMKMRSRVS
jgi:hypothetical protein